MTHSLSALAASPPSPALWHYQMVARVDTGRVRTNNEDAVSIFPQASPWPVAVLADGMGGYNAGEVASAMATSLVPAALQSWRCTAGAAPFANACAELHQALRDSLEMANAAIFNAAEQTRGCAGMGTTIVAAALLPGHLCLAHLGDSRAYGWRQGQLQQLTRDHSWLQQQVDAGLLTAEQARASELGHLVTRALGVQAEARPELTDWPLQCGDRILLCSDGISDMIDANRLSSLFAQARPLSVLLTNLITAANDAGGRDNISAVLIEACEGPPPGLLHFEELDFAPS